MPQVRRTTALWLLLIVAFRHPKRIARWWPLLALPVMFSADLTKASYDVWLGIYYYADNSRLAVVDNETASDDGRLWIGRLNFD